MPFKYILLSDYDVTAKAITDWYSYKPRIIRRYLTGDDVWILVTAKPKSQKANVMLDYEWRLVRFNGEKYIPIVGLSGHDCLRGGYERSYQEYPFGLLGNVFHINQIAPSGEYRLELKISRQGEVLTNPEWRDFGTLEVLNRGEVEVNKEFLRTRIIWAIIGIAIGAVLTLWIIPNLPDVLKWIWEHIRAY
jgi:hypothetical protein